MGIILGVMAAVCWGAADFFARYATRIVGTYRTLLFMQVFGFVGLSLFLLLTGELGHTLTGTGWQTWVWALLAVLLNIISSLALYRAFEVGVISVVSPIGASYAAVTVVLSFVSGESVSRLHAIGMGVVLVGVVLAATVISRSVHEQKATSLIQNRKPRRSGLPRGTGIAIVAALGYGFTFWIFGFHVTPVLGGVVPVWLVRLTTPLVLLAGAPLLQQNVQVPRGFVWWFLACVGVLDTAAFVAYTVGMTQVQVSVVSVIASLYSAVTIVLAGIFLREQLQWSQWLGIAVILIGVGLVNV